MTIKTENLSLGSGSILFQFYDDETETWDKHYTRIGNAPEVTENKEREELIHEDAEVRGMPEDLNLGITKTLSYTLTVDEMAPDAQAHHGYSKLGTESQAGNEANTVAITGAAPGRTYDLGKNFVGVRKLDYDGGTGIFATGETVTGAGGGTADVVQVIGDATSGTLYLENWNGTAFVDDEVLTGSVVGAAVANGADAFYEYALSVEDTDAPGTFLTAGVDYSMVSRNGNIEFLPGGYCDGDTKTNFTVKFINTAEEIETVNYFTKETLRCRIWIITDKLHGRNTSYKSWDGQLVGAGGSSLIGKTWESMEFTYTVYQDQMGHPENPWGQKKILSKAA